MITRSPKDDESLVKRLAWRFSRHFGSSREVADIEQEFWIVWMRACETFDPELGVPFGAYLTRLCKNRSIRMMRLDQAAKRTAKMVYTSEHIGGSEDSSTVGEMLADHYVDPLDKIALRERTQAIWDLVPSNLRKVVEIIVSDSPMVAKEVEAARAKAAFAKKIGINMQSPDSMTLGMADAIVGVTRNARYCNLGDLRQQIEKRRL